MENVNENSIYIAYQRQWVI